MSRRSDGPSQTGLKSFEPPTKEVADAQRRAFAAQVSDQPDFQKAVQKLEAARGDADADETPPAAVETATAAKSDRGPREASETVKRPSPDVVADESAVELPKRSRAGLLLVAAFAVIAGVLLYARLSPDAPAGLATGTATATTAALVATSTAGGTTAEATATVAPAPSSAALDTAESVATSAEPSARTTSAPIKTAGPKSTGAQPRTTATSKASTDFDPRNWDLPKR